MRLLPAKAGGDHARREVDVVGGLHLGHRAGDRGLDALLDLVAVAMEHQPSDHYTS
jgi:hypothetical protein